MDSARGILIDQAIQIGGALLILTAFLLSQMRKLRVDSAAYLLLNLTGSAILAAGAAQQRQWGFLLLEGVWALVSLAGLLAGGARRK